jgi:hypothetical protein
MICCFVSCTGNTVNLVGILSLSVSYSTWGFDEKRIITFVPIVTLNSLAIAKDVLQRMPENFYIRPVPTWKRAMNPDDMSCLDAHSHFILEAGRPELERPKSFVRRSLLCGFAICTVNCYQAVF